MYNFTFSFTLRCFVARHLLSLIYALSSVKFLGLKLRLCKKRTNIRYARTNWPGCAVVGNKFIVAGGEDKNGNYLKSTEILDLRTRNITAAGVMEKPRGMFNLLSISGTLYALGGVYHHGKRNFSANDGGFFYHPYPHHLSGLYHDGGFFLTTYTLIYL